MYCVNPECPDVDTTGRPGEYREGVWQCPYCGAALVHSPEPPAADPGEQSCGASHCREPEPVVETSDPAELEIIKSILDGAGIPYQVEGAERFRALLGGGTAFRFNPAGGSVIVVVPAEFAEEARGMLTEIAPEEL